MEVLHTLDPLALEPEMLDLLELMARLVAVGEVLEVQEGLP
jgi:hypothetical protein